MRKDECHSNFKCAKGRAAPAKNVPTHYRLALTQEGEQIVATVYTAPNLRDPELTIFDAVEVLLLTGLVVSRAA